MSTGAIIGVILTIITFVLLDLIKYNETSDARSVWAALQAFCSPLGFFLIELLLFALFLGSSLLILRVPPPSNVVLGYAFVRVAALYAQTLRYILD